MKFALRLFRWLIFVGAFTAIGASVFAYVRAQPRFSIETTDTPVAISADGTRLAMRDMNFNERGTTVQVWDARIGVRRVEWMFQGDVRLSETSCDGQHIACTNEKGEMKLVDWQNGNIWTFDELRDVNATTFSPKGHWIIAETANDDSIFVIDAKKHAIVHRVKANSPKISPDDRLLFFREGDSTALTAWDLNECKVLGTFPLSSEEYALSPDSRLLLEIRRGPKRDPKNFVMELPIINSANVIELPKELNDNRIDVWEVATFKHRFGYTLAQKGSLGFSFSPDCSFLALWLWAHDRSTALQMVDVSKATVIWSTPMRSPYWGVFSPDGSLFSIVQGVKGDKVQNMLDVESGSILWKRISEGYGTFVRNSDRFIHPCGISNRYRVCDARTGQNEVSIPPRAFEPNREHLTTPNGQHIYLRAWLTESRQPYFWEDWLDKHWPSLLTKERTLVIAASSGQISYCAKLNSCDPPLLSDDGSTLVTTEASDPEHSPSFIHVWDVHPTRAWRWAVGVALSAAFIWQFVLLRSVRALRFRKAT